MRSQAASAGTREHCQQVEALVEELREQFGDLRYAQAPVGLVVVDVLLALGWSETEVAQVVRGPVLILGERVAELRAC